MPQKRKYENDGARQAAYRHRKAEARKQELADPRLPSLPALSNMPSTVRWNTGIRQCCVLLALIRDEAAAFYDDRSETWQEGGRGEIHAERVETLTGFIEGLQDLSF